MASYARRAVESRIPSPIDFDEAGRSVPGEYSEEFIAWCTENRVKPEQAASKALRDDPADVTVMGQTGDPRGFGILLTGLDSPNYMIAAQAAMGLALIGDTRAIAPIQGAAERAPSEIALWFARALVYFESDEAHASARALVNDEATLEELQNLAAQEKAKFKRDRAMFGSR